MKALLLAVLLVAGCSASTHPLAGTFTLLRAGDTATWNYVSGNAGECRGTGGYSDFGAGMRVTVKDQAGAVIATGSTTFARTTAEGGCQLAFAVTLPDVPFYSVEVGSRGAVTYSRSDFETRGWKLDLTLGG